LYATEGILGYTTSFFRFCYFTLIYQYDWLLMLYNVCLEAWLANSSVVVHLFLSCP
jgi:hypothetical protein